MKEEKKRVSVITIGIIIVVLLVVIGICVKLFILDKIGNNVSANSSVSEITSIEGEEYVEYDEDVKVNTSEYLQETKYVNEFSFDNFYVYTVDGLTKIEFDITNSSNSRQQLDDFVFYVYGGEEKDGYIPSVGKLVCDGDEFAAGQTKRLSIVVNADIANLYDILVKPVYSSEL